MPAYTNLMRSTSVAAINSGGGGTVPGPPAEPHIVLSNSSIASGSGAGQYIGSLSVPGLTGPFTFSILEDVGGRVTTVGTYKENLYTTDVPFRLEIGNRGYALIEARRGGANPLTLRDYVAINVTGSISSDPTPDILVDLIGRSYVGTTLNAALGLIDSQLDPGGYKVIGKNQEFDMPFSMAPHVSAGSGHTYTNSGVGISSTPAAYDPVTGCTPLEITDGGNGSKIVGTRGRNAYVGEQFSIAIRFGPTAANPTPSNGYNFQFSGAFTGFAYRTENGSVYNPNYPLPSVNGGNLGGSTNLVRRDIESDGSQTLHFLMTATAVAPVNVIYGTQGGGSIKIHYIDVKSTNEITPPVATGAGGLTIPPTFLPIGGALDTLLKSTSYTVAFEFLSGFHNPRHNFLTDGSTDVLYTDGDDEILSPVAGSPKAQCGLGGTMGLVRLVVKNSPSGLKFWVNHGKPGTTATPLSLAGVLYLLKNTVGTVRKIQAYSASPSDAVCRELSSLTNRSWPYPGHAAVFPISRERTRQDFDSADTSLAYRGGDILNTPAQTSFNHGISMYAATLTGARGRPRYRHWIEPVSSHLHNINGERDKKWDPEAFPGFGPGFNKPDMGGWAGPMSFTDPAFPSCMVITATLTTELPSVVQAAQEYRQDYPGGPVFPNKWEANTAVWTGDGNINLEYGAFSITEWRIKFARQKAGWGAGWGLRSDISRGIYDARTEGDGVEQIGQDRDTFRPAIHGDYYGYNLGIYPKLPFNMDDNFHSYSQIWTPGRNTYAVSGRDMGYIDTTAHPNYDLDKQSPICNFAIDGNYPSAVSPYNASEVMPDLAGGKKMAVDYWVFYAIDPPSYTLVDLIPTTLSTITSNYSAVLQGVKNGSTVEVLSAVEGSWSYDSQTKTLSGTGLNTIAAQTVTLFERNPLGNPSWHETQVTITRAAAPAAVALAATSAAVASGAADLTTTATPADLAATSNATAGGSANLTATAVGITFDPTSAKKSSEWTLSTDKLTADMSPTYDPTASVWATGGMAATGDHIAIITLNSIAATRGLQIGLRNGAASPSLNKGFGFSVDDVGISDDGYVVYNSSSANFIGIIVAGAKAHLRVKNGKVYIRRELGGVFSDWNGVAGCDPALDNSTLIPTSTNGLYPVVMSTKRGVNITLDPSGM